MGVDEGVAVVGLRVAQTGLVELANRDHRVLGLAVDVVAVDIQVRSEIVVLLELFELLECVRCDRGVQDADVGRRLGIRAQRARFGAGGCAVGNLLDTRDAVRVARRVNVPLDVGSFVGLRARLHLETLHDPRVQTADDQPADQQQRRADDGEAPAADDGRHDEEDGDDRGDASEDGAARNGRIGLRVTGSGRQEALCWRVKGRVLVEPDACRLQRDEHCCGDGDLNARGAGDPHLTAVESECPVQVARRERADSGNQHDG